MKVLFSSWNILNSMLSFSGENIFLLILLTAAGNECEDFSTQMINYTREHYDEYTHTNKEVLS
jgi:hypothetical protein